MAVSLSDSNPTSSVIQSRLHITKRHSAYLFWKLQCRLTKIDAEYLRQKRLKRHSYKEKSNAS